MLFLSLWVWLHAVYSRRFQDRKSKIVRIVVPSDKANRKEACEAAFYR